ncbi:MAG: ATP synthase F1 subunit delta [Thermomicrobiales bacterium]
MASSAAKRYAQAVFSLGKEQNALDAWQHDLTLLSDIASDHTTAAFLSNPSVDEKQKVTAVEQALSNQVQAETLNLVRLLIERGRVGLIPQIRELFDDQLREERGIAVAHVTTAEPLTDDEREFVLKHLEQLTGKRIELAQKVDPDIIGGIIVRIGDQVIDGSVRNKLEKLRTRLVSGRR